MSGIKLSAKWSLGKCFVLLLGIHFNDTFYLVCYTRYLSHMESNKRQRINRTAVKKKEKKVKVKAVPVL
jgi:hypothetical protein